MPTIAEATAASRNGLTPVEVKAPSPLMPPPNESMQPIGTLMIRCPLPAMPFSNVSSPDSLRSYYLGNKVPQFRGLGTPQANQNANGPAGTTNVTVIGATSGGTGTGGGGGTTTNTPQTAKTVTVTTPVLVPGLGQRSAFSLSTYKAAQLLGVSSNGAARIEIYGTAAAQNADFARALDAPPPAGTAQNLVTDLALDTAPFSWSFQNRVAANRDNPQTTNLYVTITNIGTTAQALTVQLTFIPLEV